MKRIIKLIKDITSRKDFKKSIDKSDNLELQLEKYTETYRLLGKYDKKRVKNPQVLADAGRLRVYTSKLQGHSNN